MSGFAVAPQSQSDGGPYEGQEDQGNTTMPWTAETFAARHNKKATPSQAKKAASQATAMVKRGVDEGIAIATANKTVQRLKRRGSISENKTPKFGGTDQEPIDAASR